MAKWLNRILEWLLASILIVVGVFGVLHEIAEKVGLHAINPSSFTLRIVALLAFALGLERFTRFARVDKRLSELDASIHSRLPVRVIDGHEDMYNQAATLLRTCESSARAVVFANTLPHASASYVEAIFKHLQDHPLTSYHVTFVANLSDVPQEFWTAMESREAKMAAAGVRQQFKVDFINSRKPIGFDLLVIDERHCCMALSPATSHDPMAIRQAGFHFEDAPAVAKHVKSWIEQLPQPLSADQARKIWQDRHKTKGAASE